MINWQQLMAIIFIILRYYFMQKTGCEIWVILVDNIRNHFRYVLSEDTSQHILWRIYQIWISLSIFGRNVNFPAYFLVLILRFYLRGKQTFEWLQVMESFSVVWCSFLLVNVQFLVWKIGEYLLSIMKIFVLFERGKSSFNSFSLQLTLLFVNCHTVCVVTCGRRNQKEKSDLCTFDFYCYWLSLCQVKRVC